MVVKVEKENMMQNTDNMPDWDLIIKPQTDRRLLNFAEIKLYRELLFFFIWRNLKIRYKQTALGAVWAILQPVLTMVVFSVVFGQLGKIPSDGVPYPIFSLAALVPWTYFSNALSSASNSLVAHEKMISKIYFPRILLPMADVFSSLVDFAIAFCILIAMMFFFGITPTIYTLILPVLIVLAVTTALGAGLWLAAINVKYRDVKFALGFLIQFWLFISPVAYSSALIPDRWKLLYALNPMVGVIDGFRWALLGEGSAPNLGAFALSILVSAVLLVSGLLYFNSQEKTFSDII